MANQRLGFVMRTIVKGYAALFSMGFVVMAWASPGTLPMPPEQEMEVPALIEPKPKPVTPPVPSRGQMLYENHCMSCHESVAFIRDNHRTLSLVALWGRVSYWADYLRLRWGKQDVEEVVTYLNNHYYHFESR